VGIRNTAGCDLTAFRFLAKAPGILALEIAKALTMPDLRRFQDYP
jgi:hypothetical protein